jgi:hypothetical protein
MVILKLQGVCRTQSCDPPRGLEITRGPKMCKLLNLIDSRMSPDLPRGSG